VVEPLGKVNHTLDLLTFSKVGEVEHDGEPLFDDQVYDEFPYTEF
jgi:hypothetical protein